MKFTDIPDKFYLPLKIVLMIGFTLPLFLWGGQLTGLSRQAELNIIESGVDKLKQIKNNGDNLSVATKSDSSSATHEGDTGSVMGIDVSHYQGVVNWDKVAKYGIHFAFAKATGGLDYIDPEFVHNWHGIRSAELHRGAYHFFYAGDDPVKQANHFVKTMGKLRAHDMPPMLDVEIADHINTDLISGKVLIWLQTVEKATGRLPILYTDNGFADTVLTDDRLSRYPLWIADYAATIHSLPSPWKSSGWTMWQYSEKGQVKGVNGEVDSDKFKGSLTDLRNFIKKSHIE